MQKVNDAGFLSREDLPTRELKEGDRIRFMLRGGVGRCPSCGKMARF